MFHDQLFALSCRVAHVKGSCRVGAGVDGCCMDPGCVGDDDPVFILRDDAGKVAIFLALRVVVRFDDCAHSAELIFELVDAFWIIMPLRRVILSPTPMRVSYALKVFDASAIVRRLWRVVGLSL